MTGERKAKLIVFLNTLTLVGGALTVILLLRIIGNTAHQTTSTNDKIVASQKLTEQELRCLASFFSQPNRATIRISDLEKCVIIHTDTGQTETLSLMPTSVIIQSAPAVPSNDTKQNSTPITKSNQSQTASPNVKSQAAPQVKVAKKIAGISLCVPFTRACVR